MLNRAFQAVAMQNAVVEKWLSAPGELRKKVSAKGLDRQVLISQLRTVGALVAHIEFLFAGLKQLAKPPATECPDCKQRQQMAAELLVGK